MIKESGRLNLTLAEEIVPKQRPTSGKNLGSSGVTTRRFGCWIRRKFDSLTLFRKHA